MDNPTQSAPNQNAIELLEEIQRLMEMKGENPFKIRAFEKAAGILAGRDDLKERAKAGTLTELPGVGKGISEVLTEFLLQGKSTVRDELQASLPPGLLELTAIPGLGPKKAMQLIEELGISSVGELEYACRENRLLKLKGFGEKVQQKILDGISFMKTTQGQQRLDEAFRCAEMLLPMLTAAAQGLRVSETGELRRRLETVSRLQFLVEGKEHQGRINDALEKFRATSGCKIEVEVLRAPKERFGYELARTTATEAHWKALGNPEPFDAPTEEAFYEKLGIAFIAPEMRESGEEVKLAKSGKLQGILPWNGVRGVFHNHTTRSDGGATLEEMVQAARKLGMSYIGISDHSQSAFYAQGLKVPDLMAQEKEIRKVQDKYPDIRIFWGIESDILADGSLDYEPEVLKKFDFVVASIHSRFKMDRETMTLRMLEAIRNPCTRFLGHVTGRLLLGRPGYDIDMERVIAEAAKHDVAIEINSHPARLDIDWRWGPELRKCGTRVSINPDAHETVGLEDTRYGIAMARKALLPTSQVVNAGSVNEVEKWLKRL
jgi:DNA polymerase (family 10)